jgi:hypothetical protein
MKKSILFYLLIQILFLCSCTEVGLLSEKNSWILEEINTVSDFFKVYFMLQLSILIFGVFLSLIIGDLGYFIILIAHFIWIVSARDYGYLNLFLLFGLMTVISIVLNFLFNLIRLRRY